LCENIFPPGTVWQSFSFVKHLWGFFDSFDEEKGCNLLDVTCDKYPVVPKWTTGVPQEFAG
jgi:hypothetical protein